MFGFIKHAFHWVKKHWKTIAVVAAAVAVAVVVTVATGGLADAALAAGLPAFLGTAGSVFLGGAAAGATAYSLGQWLNGKPWKPGDFAKATLISGGLAVATAGVAEVAAPILGPVVSAVVPDAVSAAVPDAVSAAARNSAAGALLGGGTQVAVNAATGQPLDQNVLGATVTGGVTGAVVGPVVEGLGAPRSQPVAGDAPSDTPGIIHALDGSGGDGQPATPPRDETVSRPDTVPADARGPPVSTGEGSPSRLAASAPNEADGLPQPQPGIFKKIFGRNPTVTSDPIADAQKIIDTSPLFQQDLATLRAEGYTIKYGEPGKGFYCNTATKEIVIDPTLKNPWTLAQLLSHEFGHALEPTQQVYQPGMTRDQYIAANVQENLRNEAVACLKNIQLRDDVLARTGQDIGVNGDPANASRYEAIAHDPNLTRDQKLDQIAALWGSGTPSTAPNLTYTQYYAQGFANQWDAWVASQQHP